MSSFKRRHFLLLASSTLATLGLGLLDVSQQGSFDTKAYAQNTPRKLALLVGINEYSDGVAQLSGCVNDVLLQRELLIHRFGFNPQDILTLTDKQATRKGILQAFEEHLIKQAKPGDVVDRINTGDHKLFKDIVKTTPKHTGHLQQLPAYCNYPVKSSIVRAIAQF